MTIFKHVFCDKKPIIGMVHLRALPSSPNYCGDMDAIFADAAADLKALEDGNADAVIIENFGDIPYSQLESLPTIIAMTTLITRLKSVTSLPIGINVQFNQFRAEWLIASILALDFIRVEVFVDHRAGTHGISYAAAPELLRLKSSFPAETMIFADINVKHTFPFVEQPLNFTIQEAIEYGADALIVTGIKTGQNPSVDDIQLCKKYAQETPVLIGSGISASNARQLLEIADGAIVGSSFKKEGSVWNPVSVERIKEFMANR